VSRADPLLLRRGPALARMRMARFGRQVGASQQPVVLRSSERIVPVARAGCRTFGHAPVPA
jgi:hypothetical protein